MQITIRDTILDGNMGEGWADNYAAAPAMAAALEAEYRDEFGDGADIRIDVQRNTSGDARMSIDVEEFALANELRASGARNRALESFCSNPPAELVA